MGPFPKTRGEGLAAGTQQQGELGLLGGVQRPDEMLQSRGQQARRATLQLEIGLYCPKFALGVTKPSSAAAAVQSRNFRQSVLCNPSIGCDFTV